MAYNYDALMRQIREARRTWIDLDAGVSVCIERPPEAELADFADGRVTIDHVCRYVVDWRGVTSATLLGDAVGSTELVPFDAALWREVVRDRVAWSSKIAGAMADAITSYIQSKGAALGN